MGRIHSLAFAMLFPAALASAEPVRKTLIIGIDGLRADAFLKASAPRLHALGREGRLWPDAWADTITRSGPGWTSILTGAWSPRHGVRDNAFAGYRVGAYPHFFSRLKAARPEASVYSLVNWGPIHEKLVTHADLSLPLGDDDAVAAAAVAALSGEGGPDVLFLHFDAPDFAGHRYGFSRFSPPYRSAIAATDARVGRVLDAVAARPGRGREAWLILAVTDHGGTLRHHGEDIPECRRVPLILAGDAAPRGIPARPADAALADVAPTVLAWMGVGIDPGWALDGKALPLADPASQGPIAAREAEGAEEGLDGPEWD